MTKRKLWKIGNYHLKLFVFALKVKNINLWDIRLVNWLSISKGNNWEEMGLLVLSKKLVFKNIKLIARVRG